MSTVKNVMTTTAVVSVLLLAAACAKVPSTQIDNAEEALEAARAAEATAYAEADWSKAKEAMTAAQAEIAAQQEKFALFRSYSKATELLTEASSLARSAEAAGTAGRDQARQEAEAAIAQVRTDLDVATTLIDEFEDCPRKPKGFAQDLELLKGSLGGLAESLPGVEEAMDDGEFLEAKTLAGSLQTEISTFVQDLTAAKAKINC